MDWYNKIISHNEVARNHPDRDKKRGRIWRLRGAGNKGTGVPDFTALKESELVAKLGSPAMAQAQLAWQTLEDKKQLAPETIASLKAILTSPPPQEKPSSPYPDAARIQALWVLTSLGMDPVSGIDPVMKSPNRNVRREAAVSGLFPALDLLKDPDPEVRFAAMGMVGGSLPLMPGTPGKGSSELIRALVSAAGPSLPGPMAPSTQNGKPIRVGEAYVQEFGRYLVRYFLEAVPERTAAFLDSEQSRGLPPENIMIACLSLPAKASAPRVAKLLPLLGRMPGDEEILRLAEAPEDPAVKLALTHLVSDPAGIQALLRQKTRFDARALEPVLTEAAGSLLPKNRDLAFRVISAFQLTNLEPAVAALPLDPATLGVLRQLGSTRADLFLTLTKSTDPLLRDAALAALASTPARLLPLWPELNAAQRRRAMESLASQPEAAAALVAALESGTVARDELDGPIVDRLQAVLKDDPALKKLLDSMGNLFADVVAFDGTENAFVAAGLTLEGPFTVESWVNLAPGAGNQDSLLGAPDQIDINFYDGRPRVWAGGGINDIAVASKPVSTGIWTHLAITRDADGRFTIYLNGEPDATGTKTDNRIYKGLDIARSNAPGGMAGQLAEYRIWKTCRTAGEIRAAFDRTGVGAPGVGVAGSPLLVYRPLGAAWEGLQAGAKTVRTMDFPTLATPEAAAAIDEKFAHYRALAEKPGDPDKGRALGAVCMGCHLVAGAGGQIGPNLSSAGAMGTESLLRNILTPNAAMEPGYRVFRAELLDGSIREGFLASQDETAIVLRLPGTEDQRIPRDQLRRSSFTKRSLMPEGLEQAYSPEQWTDLFAWLKTLR